MRFQISAKLLDMPDTSVQEYLDILNTSLRQVARIFIQELVSKNGIPAWTGQARGSLKAAATLTDAVMDKHVVVSDNADKNMTTGAAQGSAKFFYERGEMGFSFRSWVVDLTVRKRVNYLQENEYSETHANRVHKTPWHLLEKAWEVASEYFESVIVPILRDFHKYLFKHSLRIKVV